MKTRLLYLFMILVMMAVSWPTRTQARKSDAVVVNIPFSFNVSNTLLPAGTYEFLRSYTHPGWLQMVNRGEPERAAFIAVRLVDNGTNPAEVKFRRYGEAYFLSQVADGVVRLELPPSAAEQEDARRFGVSETTIRASK